MANMTFLIGNGFDLNCGLKTSFTDMYDSYISIESNSNAVKQFKKDIRDSKFSHYKRWSDFEMAFAKYAVIFRNEGELLDCLSDFSQFMVQFLKEQQIDVLGKLIEKSAYRSSIIQEFVNSVETVQQIQVTQNSINSLNRILQNDKIILNFIDFNYTFILDSLINAHRRTNRAASHYYYQEVVHIHGMLQNGTVLGIDNANQIQLPFLLSDVGRMALIKPYFNVRFDNDRVNKAKQYIIGSDILCVYGLTLGDSDQTWREVVKKWLSDDASHQIIVFNHFYSSKIDSTTAIWKKIDYEMKAKKEFLSNLGFSEDETKKYESQIHCPIGTNIFNIGQVIRQEEERIKKKDNQERIAAESRNARSTGSMG